MPIPNINPSPAALAAQELVNKFNHFQEGVASVLSNGASAEGDRPAVPASELATALGTALEPLQAFVKIGA